MLPLTLESIQRVGVSALLDTGAAVNVLPFTIGTRLGFDWDRETIPVSLSGNLASADARVINLFGHVGSLSAVRLIFAWANTDAVPVILEQVNFFYEFDICFFRSRQVFEIRPKAGP